VNHLVNHNVFKAFFRLSGEIGIQSDRTRPDWLASMPPRSSSQLAQREE
jgi:hypothetical protein